MVDVGIVLGKCEVDFHSVLSESRSLGVERKEGGKLHPKLNR